MSDSPVAVRAGTSLPDRWMLPRVRQHLALYAVSWRSDLRGPTNTQQLRRQNFCSLWTSLMELSSDPVRNPDITYGQFRRQLKKHLFREARTRISVTTDMWRLRKTFTYLLTYLFTHLPTSAGYFNNGHAFWRHLWAGAARQIYLVLGGQYCVFGAGISRDRGARDARRMRAAPDSHLPACCILSHKQHVLVNKNKTVIFWYQKLLIFGYICYSFYRVALNAGQSSHEKAVCPSVCPSDKRVHCDKTEERSVQIITPYERSLSLVYWEEEWLVRNDSFYLKFWVNRAPLKRNRRFSVDIS